MVLSVVDGSIVLSTGREFLLRTSFSSERGGPRNEAPPSREVHGASWFADHASMQMVPQI